MLFNASGDHGSVAHPCLLCQRVLGAATLLPQSTTSAPPGAPTGRHGLQGLSEGLTPTASVLNKWGTPSLNDSHPALSHTHCHRQGHNTPSKRCPGHTPRAGRKGCKGVEGRAASHCAPPSNAFGRYIQQHICHQPDQGRLPLPLSSPLPPLSHLSKLL